MSYVFDARFTDQDNAATFEAWMIRRYKPAPPALMTERQAAHLEKIAAKAVAEARGNCLDCGLLLASGALKKRCLTCYAKHERVMKQASRARQKVRRTTASERAKASGWDKPTGPSRYSWE